MRALSTLPKDLFGDEFPFEFDRGMLPEELRPFAGVRDVPDQAGFQHSPLSGSWFY